MDQPLPAAASPDEVLEVRSKLQRLREGLVRRGVQRHQARHGRPGLPVRPEQRLMVLEEHMALEVVLTKLLVELLLDASTSLPAAVEGLHHKLLRGPSGEQYARTFAALGLHTLEPLVYKLGMPPLGLLEPLVLEVSNKQRAFVVNMDRMGLSRYAGVEDTGILVIMRQQQQAAAAAAAAAATSAATSTSGMPPLGPAGAPPAAPPGPMHGGGVPMPPLHGAPGPGGGMGAAAGPRLPGAPMEAFGMMPGGMGPRPMTGAMPPIIGPGGGMMPPMMPGMPPFMGGPMAPPGGMPPIMAMPPPPPAGPSPASAAAGDGPGMGMGGPDAGAWGAGDKRPRSAGGPGGGPSSSGGAADLDQLLSRKTVRDKHGMADRGGDLADVLSKPSAREAAALDRFRSEGGSAIREHCKHLTKDLCRKANQSPVACPRLHFQKLMYDWTDPSLGNCSYLDTCRNMRTCRHIHYKLDPTPDVQVPDPRNAVVPAGRAGSANAPPKYGLSERETQWINCDIRTFDMNILGKFGVIMADPPWEIHQDLPYGTMGDDEMRNLGIRCLQDDGVIFLWVTGRAMELGRECLDLWGYKRVDELIWVKTNQLQRLIRTGRTGHWLNHSKEHCLVGYKGNPVLHKKIDCDVLVAEVRETSRKPDEMYTLLERLSPGTRKIEIFARPNNIMRAHGWVGLGNQLNGCRIVEPDVRERYIAKYGSIQEPDPNKPGPAP